MAEQVIYQEPMLDSVALSGSVSEDRARRIAERRLRIGQAQERAREFAIPGRLMSDQLIAERRAEAWREEAEL